MSLVGWKQDIFNLVAVGLCRVLRERRSSFWAKNTLILGWYGVTEVEDLVTAAIQVGWY